MDWCRAQDYLLRAVVKQLLPDSVSLVARDQG